MNKLKKSCFSCFAAVILCFSSSAHAQYRADINDSVTAPSYSWAGDPDTGMYWIGANQLGFAAGGVQRASLNSNGLVIANNLQVGGTSLGGGVFLVRPVSTSMQYPYVTSHYGSSTLAIMAYNPKEGAGANQLLPESPYSDFRIQHDISSLYHVMFEGNKPVGPVGYIQFHSLLREQDSSGPVITLGDNNIPMMSVYSYGLATMGSLWVSDTGSMDYPVIARGGDTDTGMYFPGANAIGFATGGLDRVRITSAGRVGIGVTAPSVILHVSGTARIQNGSVVTCNIGTGTGTTACTSDKRLKKDITAIPMALDKIDRINGVTFRWKAKDAPQGERLGIIAQDVEKVFPQAVETMENGFKTVDYAVLVAPLIEAVKELKADIASLEASNNTLRRDNDNLRIRLERLETRVKETGPRKVSYVGTGY